MCWLAQVSLFQIVREVREDGGNTIGRWGGTLWVEESRIRKNGGRGGGEIDGIGTCLILNLSPELGSTIWICTS